VRIIIFAQDNHELQKKDEKSAQDADEMRRFCMKHGCCHVHVRLNIHSVWLRVI